MKFMLTIFKRNIKYIHIVVKQACRASRFCKSEGFYLLNNNSPFPSPQVLGMTILLSVSINLITLDSSYK